MKALNAFKAAAKGTLNVIPSALVPNLISLIPGSRPFVQGSKILYAFLRQSGLSNDEIALKSPLEWSKIKMSQLDKGLSIKNIFAKAKDMFLERIPKTRQEWAGVVAYYAIPGGKKGIVKLKKASGPSFFNWYFFWRV